MFEMTTPAGDPIRVHVSFWQCAKAGAAFALSASVVTAIGAYLFARFLYPWYVIAGMNAWLR